MDYTRLGASGLQVSRIGLGCMGFGEPGRGDFSWSLDHAAALPIFAQALEAGINFFDTANIYSAGSSEEITGRALLSLARREDVVIATKVWGRTRPGPNGRGLSRRAILHEIDASLRRLGTDYVDLYQVHRWDARVPVEETLEALHDVVKAGKARYIGASSMAAWQLSKALYVAERHSWTRFISMQGHYNLLYREEEREMLPLCLDQGIGVLPWKPLAAGLLAREWDARTPRSARDDTAGLLYDERDRGIVDAVGAVAAARGVPRAQVALAWLLAQPAVTAPVVGATAPGHLSDAVAALQLELTDEELLTLGAEYRAHDVAGF